MKKPIKIIIPIVLILIFLTSLGTSIYFYRQYSELKNNPDVAAKKESEILINEVSQILQLPTDETPTVATILDKEKLKDQAFFNDSQNGDKILIYTKAQKAIIYRESENKIINVGPILLDQKSLNGTGNTTSDTTK